MRNSAYEKYADSSVFFRETTHETRSCLHVQAREKTAASRCFLQLSQLVLWELLPFRSSSITITAATGKVHVQPQASVNNSLYTVNSQTQQLFYLFMRFCARKTKKENEKNGEKTITEDACVSLWYLSYSHLIVQHKQQKNISLFNSYSFPSVYSCALPSRLLKMRPNQKIYIAMGRIDGWMSCIWLQIWCKTTRSPYCVFRY